MGRVNVLVEHSFTIGVLQCLVNSCNPVSEIKKKRKKEEEILVGQRANISDS